MRLKKFLEMYDNWNGDVVINDDELKPIIKGLPSYILFWGNVDEKEVVAFGFYDGELAVRVK